MLKKLSSFANTYGGLILIGGEDGGVTGRMSKLPGVVPKNSYKQTVVKWCFEGVSPPLTVEVSDPIWNPDGSERVCYVLSVAESELAPHFINGREGVYVRTDEYSGQFKVRLANENEIRSLLGRRKIIRERRAALIGRARGRFQSFVEQRYTARAAGKETVGARFDLTIVPRFPAKPILDEAALDLLIKSFSLPWRGTQFPHRRGDCITQHESTLVLGPGSAFSMLEANVWGMLFFATELEEIRDERVGMHLYQFLGNLLVFLKYAAGVLSRLGYAGPLRLGMHMKAMRGIRWLHGPSDLLQEGPTSELDDEICFAIDMASEELTKSFDPAAVDILRYVFFATNWPETASITQHLRKIVVEAYKYNKWT